MGFAVKVVRPGYEIGVGTCAESSGSLTNTIARGQIICLAISLLGHVHRKRGEGESPGYRALATHHVVREY
jgi:hypothetical protein